MSGGKKGRPFSDNPKSERLEIRLNKQQAEDLKFCAEKLGISKTEVILMGIEKVRSETEE